MNWQQAIDELFPSLSPEETKAREEIITFLNGIQRVSPQEDARLDWMHTEIDRAAQVLAPILIAMQAGAHSDDPESYPYDQYAAMIVATKLSNTWLQVYDGPVSLGLYAAFGHLFAIGYRIGKRMG